MRKIIALCSVLCSSSTLAVNADFSKSFVIPERSGINNVTVGGIDAIGNSYSVDFNLREDLTLSITDAVIQDSLSEILEQSLRNTTWQGTYSVNDNSYTSTLNLVVVQNGYVGGEITHSQINEDQSGFLKARLTGDIITQFEINGSFADEDRISVEELNQITKHTPNRQLIRIKRMRALEFVTTPGSSGWSTNREYRLILENEALSGIVGVPNDVYGTNDGTSENGTIELIQQ